MADGFVEAGEVDRVAGPAGRDGERDGDVGLADPGWPEQGGVGLGLDECQGGEVFDLAWVEVGLEGEVVVVEGLVVGQLEQLQAGAGAGILDDDDPGGSTRLTLTRYRDSRLSALAG